MRQDTFLAGLGLLVGVLLLGTNLVITHILARTVPVALIFACLVYLAARLWPIESEPNTPVFGYPQVGLIVVLFGSAILVGIAALSGGRSVPFYVLASLLGSVVLLQVFFTPDRHLHPGAILAQVLLLIAVIRFPALYTVPGFTGIDVWIHVPDLTHQLLETGSVEAMGDSKYVGSPLYHLVTVTTALFADVTLREALYLSVGVLLVVTSVFVYTTTRYVVAPRWALFAAALYGLSEYFIRWSIHVIPTSLSVAIFFGIVFLLFRRLEGIGDVREDMLLVVLFLSLALTHQLSSVIVLSVLGAAILAHILYVTPLVPLKTAAGSRPVTIGIASTTLVSYFVYKAGLLSFVWSLTPYYGDTLLDGAVTTVQEDIDTLTEGGGGSDVTERDPEEATGFLDDVIEYLDRLGFILLLFGTTVGSLVVSQSRRLTQTTFVVVIVVGVVMAITLVPPVLGIDSLLPGRWYPFLYVGMVILTAIGFAHLRTSLAVSTFVVVAVLFAMVYPGAMIFATTATPDNPAFEEHATKYSYTESELVAAETLIERTTMDEGAIFSDHPYVLTLNRLGEVQFGIASIDEDGSATNDRTVYREYQSTGAPVFDVGGDQQIRQVSETEMCEPGANRLYSNGQVAMCDRGQ